MLFRSTDQRLVGSPLAVCWRRLSGCAKEAGVAVTAILVLATCSAGEPGPEIPENAVLITQGTSPTVEGLSIGLGSVSGDEARLSIAQPEQQAELFTAKAGETIEVGDYTVEIFEVETNYVGGSVRLKVTPQGTPDPARPGSARRVSPLALAT